MKDVLSQSSIWRWSEQEVLMLQRSIVIKLIHVFGEMRSFRTINVLRAYEIGMWKHITLEALTHLKSVDDKNN